MTYTIRFTDIQYQYLTDEKYFRLYNLDNELTQEEIEETIEDLQNETEYTFDGFEFDEDELNDEGEMTDYLWNWLEMEIGWYITDFSYEVLVD